MSMIDRVRGALAVDEAYFALGNECFVADGATFVRNRVIPDIRDANRVTSVSATTPEAIERLLARVEQEFAGFPYCCFHVDSLTPPAVESVLLLAGYQRAGEMLVMLLEGDLIGDPKPHDTRPIDNEASWNAYAELKYADWRENQARIGHREGDHVAQELVQMHRAKAPPVRYRMAYVDGEPRAYCSSWLGPNGFGQLEDLFTHPDFRHRGLATALIHRCVADCRQHGAGPVMLLCDATDTPKHMYAAMGFRPIAIKRGYWKNLES